MDIVCGRVLTAALLTALATSIPAQAGEFDLPMADEITDRFSQKRWEAPTESPPLVDFVFSFSRAVHERHGPPLCSKSSGGFYGPPITWIQREDVLLAELRAREKQIAADLKVKAVIAAAAPAQRRMTVPAGGAAPVKLDPTWLEVAPPREPQKGWSGMTLAVEGVALRFVDEGGAAPVQYR